MIGSERVVVVGLGEVGRPLLELVSERFEAIGIDVDTPAVDGELGASVLHICFPFEIDDFVGETASLHRALRSSAIIGSTVAAGTKRAIHERTGAPVAHRPIRGKHAKMLEDLRSYTKYVGGIDAASAAAAATHFESIGLATTILSSPETTELAKLTEATYFGLLIAWVPGVIGGHCVMPNVDILRQVDDSDLLRAIKSSNAMRIEQELERIAAESAASGAGSSK